MRFWGWLCAGLALLVLSSAGIASAASPTEDKGAEVAGEVAATEAADSATAPVEKPAAAVDTAGDQLAVFRSTHHSPHQR